jgi:hypothetical protein
MIPMKKSREYVGKKESFSHRVFAKTQHTLLLHFEEQ